LFVAVEMGEVGSCSKLTQLNRDKADSRPIGCSRRIPLARVLPLVIGANGPDCGPPHCGEGVVLQAMLRRVAFNVVATSELRFTSRRLRKSVWTSPYNPISPPDKSLILLVIPKREPLYPFLSATYINFLDL